MVGFGQAGELDHAERLAAGPRVDAGRAQRLLGAAGDPAQPAQRRPQRLAALGERGVDEREHLGAGRRRSAAARAGPARPARSRRWAPARRRCARPIRPGARRRTTPPSPTARRRSCSRAAPRAGRPPRPAPSPAPCCSDGQQLEQVQQHRDRRRCTAGSRPARSGAGDGRASMRSASAVTTVNRPAYAGACLATVAGSSPASSGSISTAITACATGSSPRVSEPRPGPDLDDRRRRT